MAQYPSDQKTWLGGPVTIVANENPPEPLAPNTKFTTLLLIVDRSIKCPDGKTIQLYRMTPLYTEERQLELEKGLPALMRAMDRANVPEIVDLKRRNFALRE
jgi:hypothetical protein